MAENEWEKISSTFQKVEGLPCDRKDFMITFLGQF